jgi:two-component system phosphate regulon sensor histidine kinase PhoR
MAPVLDDLDVTVNRQRSRKGMRVKCDRKLITQVIVNLLDNAIKYSPDRRVIDIHTEHREDMVALFIRDYGIGIKSDESEKIFEEFYRSDQDLVREIKGTGLGLAIVKKIVEEHKGHVSALPAEGGGLHVTVELPAGEEEV